MISIHFEAVFSLVLRQSKPVTNSAFTITTETQDNDVANFGGAPAYGRPSHQLNSHNIPRPGEPTGTPDLDDIGRRYVTRGKWQIEGSPSDRERKQDFGKFRDQAGPGSRKSTANTSTLGRSSEQFRSGRQHQHLVKRQVRACTLSA